MTGFDAELYLRLHGEDALRRAGMAGEGNGYPPWHDPLIERARALVAVGALPTAVADKVIGDYARARQARGNEEGPWPHFGVGRGSHGSAPQPPTPRRVAGCEGVIEQPWGALHLRYAILTSTETRLVMTMRPSPAAGQQSPSGSFALLHHRALAAGGPFPGGPFSGGPPPALQVTDDRGTTVSMTFSGGGSQDEWSGSYVAPRALSTRTRWLDILSERIELVDNGARASVEIQHIDDGSAAEHYLQTRLLGMSADRHYHASLETTIDTLVASNSLPADSPAIAEARAVEGALIERQHGAPRRQLKKSVLRKLSPWWQSLFARRGGRKEASMTLFLGVTTPAFDAITATVIQLESTPRGFLVDLVLTGAGFDNHHEDSEQTRVTYSATDDRGNGYLGSFSPSDGDGETSTGQVEFWPSLDPLATRLDLALGADRARAVIHIPLGGSAAT